MDSTEHMIKRRLHKRLGLIIILKGTWTEKKHGAWWKLQITEDYFLQLDSWSGAIYLIKGAGIASYWCGYSGTDQIYFGLDFGGFCPNVSETFYRYFVDRVERLPNR